MGCVGELPLLFFLWCKFRRASLKVVAAETFILHKFRWKMSESGCFGRGPHFEQLSMESETVFFFEKSRNFGGSSRGAPGAPWSSGELRGVPGKLRKSVGNSHFSGGTAAGSF